MYRLNAVFQMLSDLLNEAFLRLAGENSNNPTQRLHQTGTRNVSSMQQPNMKPRQACTAADFPHRNIEEGLGRDRAGAAHSSGWENHSRPRARVHA